MKTLYGRGNSLSFSTTLVSVLVLFVMTCSLSVCPGGERSVRQRAEVYLKDGTVLKGTVELTVRNNFYFWVLPEGAKGVGGRLPIREFNFDVISEMTFKKLSERRKCDVVFNDGTKLTGIFKSVVVYLRSKDPDDRFAPDKITKLLIKSQMREEQKVKRIVILDEGRKVHTKIKVKIKNFNLGKIDQVYAITANTLKKLEVEPLPNGTYEVKGSLGEEIKLAVRVGDTYLTYLPPEAMERTDLFKEVEAYCMKIADYQNERELLGIIPNETGSVIQAVMKLRRQVPASAPIVSGGAYDKQGAYEYALLSIWTWRRHPKNGEMALIQRGSFFRDRVPPHSETPPMIITEQLKTLSNDGEQIVIGSDKD